MEIKVRFFALYREIVGQGEMEMEVKEGTTAFDLWRRLGEDFPRLTNVSHSLAFAVNMEYASPDTELRDGDEVAFIPPVSGGGNLGGRRVQNHEG